MGRTKSLVLTEDHQVIKSILKSNRIDDVTRLQALADLNHLETINKLWEYPEYSDEVDELFEWDDSELGSTFWANIQDKVFKPEKRMC